MVDSDRNLNNSKFGIDNGNGNDGGLQINGRGDDVDNNYGNKLDNSKLGGFGFENVSNRNYNEMKSNSNFSLLSRGNSNENGNQSGMVVTDKQIREVGSAYKKKKKPVNKDRNANVYEKYSKVVHETIDELNAHHGEDVQFKPKSGFIRSIKKLKKLQRTRRRRDVSRKKASYKGKKKPAFVKKL